MPLIRPEINALLRRWSEVLTGLGIAAFGLWALQVRDSFLQVIVGLVLLAGLGIALNGWRRLRFQRDGQAPGIVQIVEGQIAFFGPDTGGFIALRDLVELHLIDRAHMWHLISEDGRTLDIPVSAQGSDALFDAFTTLTGLNMSDVLAALDKGDAQERQVVWLHPARRGQKLRLH